MSNKVNAITIVLREDVSETYADALINAIKMFDNILSVEANVVTTDYYVADMRIRKELWNKMYETLYPKSSK